MVAVAVVAVLLTLFAPKDIFSRVLFSWVALGAAIGPAVLTRCLGWHVRGGAVFLAIGVGFGIAVVAYSVPGTIADVIEKWGSWVVGLATLYAGRLRNEFIETDNNQTSRAGLS
jgi:sodium/proline symporter